MNSFIHNGYLVHPSIWMLWFSFFGTILNTVCLFLMALKGK